MRTITVLAAAVMCQYFFAVCATASQQNAQAIPPDRSKIDLLAGIDIDRDAERGEWKRVGDGVKNLPMNVPRSGPLLRIPARLDSNYNVQIAFTREQGADAIFIALPIRNKKALLALNSQSADGQWVHYVNDVKTPGRLKTGERHILNASIEDNGETYALKVVLDGTPILNGSWPLTSLKPSGIWESAKEGALSISVVNSEYLITEISVETSKPRSREVDVKPRPDAELGNKERHPVTQKPQEDSISEIPATPSKQVEAPVQQSNDEITPNQKLTEADKAEQIAKIRRPFEESLSNALAERRQLENQSEIIHQRVAIAFEKTKEFQELSRELKSNEDALEALRAEKKDNPTERFRLAREAARIRKDIKEARANSIENDSSYSEVKKRLAAASERVALAQNAIENAPVYTPPEVIAIGMTIEEVRSVIRHRYRPLSGDLVSAADGVEVYSWRLPSVFDVTTVDQDVRQRRGNEYVLRCQFVSGRLTEFQKY